MNYQILQNFTFSVSLCIVVGDIQVVAFWLDFDMVGFDNANGSLIITDGRMKRINKKSFAISGTVEIVSDFSNDWQFEGLLFYSSIGNNQFTKSALGVPRTDLCNIMDGVYLKGNAQYIAERSDFPVPKKGESLCAAYKKGKYTVRDLMFYKGSIPIFLHTGVYKAQYTFSNKHSGEVNALAIYFKLY